MKTFIVIFFISLTTIIAQESVIFKPNKQFYVYGDAALIGNNIVSKDAKEPFNHTGTINDLIKMTYVDIDDDSKTFSSSQATLSLPDNTSKIVYAALYWSAVYSYETGVKRRKGDIAYYKGKGERDPNVNTILFKTPKSKNYQSVTGKVLFDGHSVKKYKEKAPYVCFADVTKLLNDSKKTNGEYTVANIKATQGFISGGVSAGWLLYVVYEAPTSHPKYITTYNGFTEVVKDPVDIKFSDFKTKKDGDIKASLYMAVLEGDSKIRRDQCAILTPKDSTLVFLSNQQRPALNFFNSKISIDDKPFTKRKPNSRNTLGFDLLKINIPNDENKLINNNSKEFTLRFVSKLDRFYLFFTAFQTEISTTFYTFKKENPGPKDLATTTPIDTPKVKETPKVTPKDTLKTETVKTKPPLKEVTEIAEPVKVVEITEADNKEIRRITRKQPLKIPELEKGYYVVTNVFSKPNLVIRWEQFLKSKGYQYKTFVNPDNNWHYVSIYNNEDVKESYKKRKELIAFDYFKDVWVFKVNMD